MLENLFKIPYFLPASLHLILHDQFSLSLSNLLAIQGIIIYALFPKTVPQNSDEFDYIQKKKDICLMLRLSIQWRDKWLNEANKGLLSRLYEKHLEINKRCWSQGKKWAKVINREILKEKIEKANIPIKKCFDSIVVEEL